MKFALVQMNPTVGALPENAAKIARFAQAGTIFIGLIKPLVKRLWLPSHALGDAQRIVDAVRFPSKRAA